jgi:hypothetical protein
MLFGQNETTHRGFCELDILPILKSSGSLGILEQIVGSPGPIYCSVMLEKGSPGTTLATEKEGIILKSCKKGLVIKKTTFVSAHCTLWHHFSVRCYFWHLLRIMDSNQNRKRNLKIRGVPVRSDCRKRPSALRRESI